eukprot:IDg8538t1
MLLPLSLLGFQCMLTVWFLVLCSCRRRRRCLHCFAGVPGPRTFKLEGSCCSALSSDDLVCIGFSGMVNLKAIGFEARAFEDCLSWLVSGFLMVSLGTDLCPLDVAPKKRPRKQESVHSGGRVFPLLMHLLWYRELGFVSSKLECFWCHCSSCLPSSVNHAIIIKHANVLKSLRLAVGQRPLAFNLISCSCDSFLVAALIRSLKLMSSIPCGFRFFCRARPKLDIIIKHHYWLYARGVHFLNCFCKYIPEYIVKRLAKWGVL